MIAPAFEYVAILEMVWTEGCAHGRAVIIYG